jgi:hypothetical protein
VLVYITGTINSTLWDHWSKKEKSRMERSCVAKSRMQLLRKLSNSAENFEINQTRPEGVQNHIPPQRCVATIRNESDIKKSNWMDLYTAPDWLSSEINCRRCLRKRCADTSA